MQWTLGHGKAVERAGRVLIHGLARLILPQKCHQEEVDDDNGCANQVVVEVSSEKPHFRKNIDQPVHDLEALSSPFREDCRCPLPHCSGLFLFRRECLDMAMASCVR
jgi:hypothetical protein